LGRFIKFEENEDNTISGSMDVGFGEINFLIEMSFDTLATVMQTLAPEAQQQIQQVAKTVTVIPDSV
jgi:hypothetical protein